MTTMPELSSPLRYFGDPLVLRAVRHWLIEAVVGWELCPFAKRELVGNSIRFATTEAADDEGVLLALAREMRLLWATPELETSLLICSRALQSFENYNQFLDLADELLDQLDLVGVLQVASFHPQYRFEGTEPEDLENATNRAPYPIFHLLREASVERAVESYPKIDEISARNIEHLRALGADRVLGTLRASAGKADEFLVRDEEPTDHAAVEELHRAAFAGLEHSDGSEPSILRRLRADGALTLSVVAERAGEVVAHAAFSPVEVVGSQGDEVAGWYGLGPVATHPDEQGHGYGTAVIVEGLTRLQEAGAQGCVVLGEPKYYQRFGFRQAPVLVYQDVLAEHFQALPLNGDSVPSGAVRYHEAFTPAQ